MQELPKHYQSPSSTCWTATILSSPKSRRQLQQRFSHAPSKEDEAILTSSSRNSSPRQRSNNYNNNKFATLEEKQWMEWERELVFLGRQGRTDEALDLFHSLMKQTLSSSLYPSSSNLLLLQQNKVRWWNAAMDACARARPTRLETALSLFQQGRKEYGLDPNVFTFGILTSACARARRADQALRLLRAMESTFGVTPNAVVYSATISACARAHPQPQLDMAWHLLHEATVQRGLVMNVVGYNAVLAACANAGDWQRAMDLLDQMEQSTTTTTTTTSASSLQQQQQHPSINASANNTATTAATTALLPLPPPPDVVTYGTVMAACEKGEQWSLVLACAQRAMQRYESDTFLDTLALTSALHACQHLGLAQEALYYLNLMKKKKHQHQQQQQSDNDQNDDSSSFSSSSSLWKRSTKQNHRIGVKQPLCGPDAVAYRLAISACARGGAWQEGLRLLEELRAMPKDNNNNNKNNAADVVAYTAAMNGCEYAGEWQQALALLEQMRVQDQVQPNHVTMASVMGACATACAKLMATTTSHNNNNNNNLGSTGTTTGSSVLSSSSSTTTMLLPQKKALQLLQIMKKDPTVVRPNIVVYNAAIRVCAEAGDLVRSFALWEDLRREGLVPTVVTYGSLMTACERVGSMDGLSKVFKYMKEQEQQQNEENGNNTTTTTTTGSMKPNEVIYGAAISCCRKAREPERALLLLRQMIRDGLQPNIATFHTVLVAQTEGRNEKADLERAILVYKLMKASSSSSPLSGENVGVNTPALSPVSSNCRPNRQTYNLLIRAFASRKYPHEAELLLRQMQQDGIVPDVDLYTATVAAYERTGQPLQALRLMESMRQDGYDFYESKVLNEAFKKAIKLVNVVGRGLTAAPTTLATTTTRTTGNHLPQPTNNNLNRNQDLTEDPPKPSTRFSLSEDDGQVDAFINGRAK